jgi:hypothetical protein
MLTLLITALAAFAEPIDSGATVLTGVGATFDDNPATLRLEVQGEVPLATGSVAGLGLVLPVELTTGVRPMVTVVPSLRLRVANALPVRFYGDGGIGLAQTTERPTQTGWGTRFVLGAELGPADGGVAVVFEPVGLDVLRFPDDTVLAYAARLGVGVRY